MCSETRSLGKGTSVPGLWPWSAEGWSGRSTGKTRATALLGRLHRLQLSCPLAAVLFALRMSLTGMGWRAALTGHSDAAHSLLTAPATTCPITDTRGCFSQGIPPGSGELPHCDSRRRMQEGPSHPGHRRNTVLKRVGDPGSEGVRM